MKSASELLVMLLVSSLAACQAGGAEQTSREREDPLKCATCHTPELKSTMDPPHIGVRPTTCGVCHTQSSWKPWRVDHPWWELTGAHARAAADKELAGKEKEVKCNWCHRGDPATFKRTKKACVACHAEDRERSTFPDHETFADTCQDCHSTERWKGAKEPPRPAPLETDAGLDLDASVVDASVDAGRPRAVVRPKPKPKPLPKPPDVITGPSRLRHAAGFDE